jgi:hypothetical protein
MKPKLIEPFEANELEETLKTLQEAKLRLSEAFHVKWHGNLWFSQYLHAMGFLKDSISTLQTVIIHANKQILKGGIKQNGHI